VKGDQQEPAGENLRDNPAHAERVMLRACPDPAARRFLMLRLLSSIALAEQAGPRSWALTLFEQGFRLNVGQVEALVYLKRVVRVFMLGSVSARAYTVGEIIPCSFRSLPQPQLAFYGSVGELERIHAALAPAHRSFLQTAAVTSRGKPRRCPYSRYHSEGLYRYARQVAGSVALLTGREK
jgi:hypothetical protein